MLRGSERRGAAEDPLSSAVRRAGQQSVPGARRESRPPFSQRDSAWRGHPSVGDHGCEHQERLRLGPRRDADRGTRNPEARFPRAHQSDPHHAGAGEDQAARTDRAQGSAVPEPAQQRRLRHPPAAHDPPRSRARPQGHHQRGHVQTRQGCQHSARAFGLLVSILGAFCQPAPPGVQGAGGQAGGRALLLPGGVPHRFLQRPVPGPATAGHGKRRTGQEIRGPVSQVPLRVHPEGPLRTEGRQGDAPGTKEHEGRLHGVPGE